MTTTVLAVDDEPAITDMYEAWLTEYQVIVANGGREALSALDRRGDDVDVVLLDRKMPGMSGDEVLAEIADRDVDCQVAMVTGVVPSEDIVEMPFDDYVTKPLSTGQINETVERLLERAEFADALDRYYTLVTKHALLTTERPVAELRESQAFANLEAELRRLERELDESAQLADHREFQYLLTEVTGNAT